MAVKIKQNVGKFEYVFMVNALHVRHVERPASFEVHVRPQGHLVGAHLVNEASLPSVGLRLSSGSASRLLAALRRGEPCVIGRIEDGAVMVDLRTVAPDQDAGLTTALQQALG